jgi:hypothetical protein
MIPAKRFGLSAVQKCDIHWVVTGPHIMVFGPASKTLGYTEAKDPDPTEPLRSYFLLRSRARNVPLCPRNSVVKAS